jgi:hypothetical protein
MKQEMIDSIAKEINRQCREFQEQVVMKAVDENAELITLYHGYKGTIFPLETKKEFASLYSQTAIFVFLSAALFDSGPVQDKDLNKILLDIIRRLKCTNPVLLDILESISNLGIPGPLSTFIMKIK